MPSNEILTLQFGHYSNFIGTHWWHIQESGFQYDPNSPSEIKHDVLFREGLTLKGEVTFTPRLLLVDLKGSLRSLSEQGELYKTAEEVNEMGIEATKIEEKQEKNNFQKDLDEYGTIPATKCYDLDNEVQVWSDFLYTRFHPRTVNIVKQYQYSNENTSFNIYPLGLELWKNQQFSEDFIDKIRNYIEECDNFHGFQLLHDCCDGFSGLSTSCVEYLNDEYNTKAVLTFPVNINAESKNPIHLLNTALCFNSLIENSSLFIPLSSEEREFSFISYRPELFYQSSAILASALDTITLTYRLKYSKYSVIDLCSDLGANGRKAAAASVCLPFPIKKKEDFIDCLNNLKGPLLQTITPNCNVNMDENLQMLVLRGIPESRLKSSMHASRNQRDMPAYRCESLEEMLGYYMVCTNYRSKTEVVVAKEQMPVKTPYPNFFDKRVDKFGDIDLTRKDKVNVEKVNVLAGLHSGKFVGDLFDTLSKSLKSIKYKHFHQFNTEGVETDQLKECFDHILDLRDCYKNNYLL